MLTKDDFSIISDQDFLIHKRAVLGKITTLLSEVEVGLKNSKSMDSTLLPIGTLTKSGKISRGDNYKGLPYLVLDYPRYSHGNEIFLFRTMFWWGNYFLCMLISQNCSHRLKDNLPTEKVGFFLNHGKSPWNYDLADVSWKPMNKAQTLSGPLPFISIGKRVNFNEIDQLADISRATFDTVLSFLTKKN